MKILTLLYILIILFVLGSITAFILSNNIPEIDEISSVNKTTIDLNSINRGENLAAIGGCSSCHTRVGGKAYAGGVLLTTPFGKVYSTNITPDLQTGIGTWSYSAFRRAMYKGISREGNHLYPVFPYDHFSKVFENDVKDIYNYIMSLDPISEPRKPNQLSFPFNFRSALAGWKFFFLEEGVYENDPNLNDNENRGAYLVKGLGHCSACHSPRNIFGAVEKKAFLMGGNANGWHAPALGKGSIGPAPWSLNNYVDYLFDGWSPAHGIAAGPMTEVVDQLYDATKEDIYAISEYLVKLSPVASEIKISEIQKEMGKLDWVPNEETKRTLFTTSQNLINGEKVFSKNCTKCHKKITSDDQPISLGLSASINAKTPINFLNIVNDGILPPYSVPTRNMPSMGHVIKGKDLADLTSYIRKRFTNKVAWEGLEYLIKSK